MKLSQIAMATVLLSAAASGPALARGTITMTDPNGGGNTWRDSWSGGAFRATHVSGFNGATGGPGGGGDSFLTFCLEITENIQLGNTYTTVISDRAMNGGNNDDNNGPGDPISAVTAAIYAEFRRGGSDSFGSAHIDLTGVGDHSSATRAVQNAIWFEEDEISTLPAGMASQVHNWGLSYVAANGNGLGNVRVMQLTNGDGSRAQDQLTLIPLPSAALAGLASLVGVLGVRSVRRRRP